MYGIALGIASEQLKICVIVYNYVFVSFVSFQIDVCNEMSQPNFTSNVPASEILSHDQLCEMKRYEDIDVPEDEDEISRIAFFVMIHIINSCKIFDD